MSSKIRRGPNSERERQEEEEESGAFQSRRLQKFVTSKTVFGSWRWLRSNEGCNYFAFVRDQRKHKLMSDSRKADAKAAAGCLIFRVLLDIFHGVRNMAWM